MPGIAIQDLRTRDLVMYRGTLTDTTSTLLYTVPTGKTVKLTNVVLSNSTAGAVTVTLTVDGVSLVPAYSIPANSLVSFDMNQAIQTGGLIRGGASSGSAIGCHISGQVVT